MKGKFSRIPGWFKSLNSSARVTDAQPVEAEYCSGVAVIGDREYAVNLHWENAKDSDQTDFVARARAKVDGIDADFYCVSETDKRQFGLGFKSKGHRKGMPVLATIIASRIEGNWLGMFEVGDCWYLLGVMDNCVFAETDRCFSTPGEAFFHYGDALLSMGNVDRYVSGRFTVADCKAVNLSQLLDGDSSERLRPVDRWNPLGKWMAAVSVACMLLIGVENYFGEAIRHGLSTVIGMVIGDRASPDAAGSEDPDVQPMPWEGRPHGLVSLEACVESMGRFVATVPGWGVKELICDGKSASAMLSRNADLGAGGGSVTWILPFVRRNGFEPEVVPASNGTSGMVEVTWQLEPSPAISDAVETVPLHTVKTALFHGFESRLTPILFEGAESGNHWREQKFRFATRFDPLYFRDVLGSVPVWLIGRVHYDTSSAVWTLEGKYYEKLKTPIQMQG